ncbi:hypothetical protein [Roseobacter litoralis]|uniref:hypothetical protein n=1 Tax=Roseobacter litoralis TaxID=42443 RepID=UPI00248F8E14|nr:hypothetical protein [Roseobacter litoralis]
MSDTFTQFERRLDTLERKHRALANGYVAGVNPDGLITIAPKAERSGSMVRFGVAVAFGFVAFKAMAVAVIGPATYQGRIDTLASGNTFEKVCAWVMQADPVSQKVATFLLATVG